MNATDQRVPNHSRCGPSLAVIVVPPSCLKQGSGRGCTTSLTFQLNPRGKYLIKRREVCNTFQKWNAEKIKARAEGRRKANQKPRFSAEAARRAADKLARQFSKKQQKSTEVALPANRSIVVDRNFLLDSGASYNIIGRDEITEKNGQQCGRFRL